MNVLYTVGALCGCLAAIGGIFWGFWSFLRKVVHIVDALEQIKKPVQELKNNGGSSVKDKVDDTHELVVGLVDRVRKLEELQGEQRQRTDH